MVNSSLSLDDSHYYLHEEREMDIISSFSSPHTAEKNVLGGKLLRSCNVEKTPFLSALAAKVNFLEAQSDVEFLAGCASVSVCKVEG